MFADAVRDDLDGTNDQKALGVLTSRGPLCAPRLSDDSESHEASAPRAFDVFAVMIDLFAVVIVTATLGH